MFLVHVIEKLLNRRNVLEVEKVLDSRGNSVNLDEVVEKAESSATVYSVTNIKAISEEILSKLKAGDVVQKVDSSGKHSYIVSFKKDGTGICLTYTDASIVETQSYDFTEGHWVYNSEDLSSVGGTKLYKHTITNIGEDNNIEDTGTMVVYSASSEPITDGSELAPLLDTSLKALFSGLFGLCVVYNSYSMFQLENTEASGWLDCAFVLNEGAIDTVTPL